jgi:hypothetical protein
MCNFDGNMKLEELEEMNFIYYFPNIIRLITSRVIW